MGTIQFKALTFNYSDQTQPLFDHVTLIRRQLETRFNRAQWSR